MLRQLVADGPHALRERGDPARWFLIGCQPEIDDARRASVSSSSRASDIITSRTDRISFSRPTTWPIGAMSLLQATHDLRKVSLWLGHTRMETTEIYLPPRSGTEPTSGACG